MKAKYQRQVATFTHTLAVGVNQAEVTAFPELVAGDAIIPKQIMIGLDAASAAPSVTGAGLTIFSIAITTKEQTSPADLLSLDELAYLRQYTTGETGVGPFRPGYEWANFDPRTRDFSAQGLPAEPSRQFWVFGHTVNISNAATTILRFRVMYDVVTLSLAEQVAFLAN